MSGTKVMEKNETQMLFPILFFLKSYDIIGGSYKSTPIYAFMA
jgi:hypothetical protein